MTPLFQGCGYVCAAHRNQALLLRSWGGRAGARAQLVAVGLATGEVALYRLWAAKASDPLRVISLADWGYEPEATGSVADLQWAPDNRAIAVRPVGCWTGVHFPGLFTAGAHGCALGLSCHATQHNATTSCSLAAARRELAWVFRPRLIASHPRQQPRLPTRAQVGWRRSGLGLWSPSGCRLVCSLRQAGAARAARTPAAPPVAPGYKPALPLSLEARKPSLQLTQGLDLGFMVLRAEGSRYACRAAGRARLHGSLEARKP